MSKKWMSYVKNNTFTCRLWYKFWFSIRFLIYMLRCYICKKLIEKVIGAVILDEERHAKVKFKLMQCVEIYGKCTFFGDLTLTITWRNHEKYWYTFFRYLKLTRVPIRRSLIVPSPKALLLCQVSPFNTPFLYLLVTPCINMREKIEKYVQWLVSDCSVQYFISLNLSGTYWDTVGLYMPIITNNK